MSLYGDKQLPIEEAPTLQFTAPAAFSGPSPSGTAAGGPQPAGTEPTGTGAEDGTGRGKRRSRMLIAAGVVALLLATVGVTAAYAYAGEVPRGTMVLGVDLGGRSRAEAAGLLRAELSRRADAVNAPLPVRIGEKSGEINPTDVGLAVDVEATVAAALASDPDPVSLLFGSREIPPVVMVDAARLDEQLRRIAGPDGQQMTLPAITFKKTTPKVTYPEAGQSLDAERSAQAVRDGWLSGQPVTVPLVETHPATSREEVDRLLAELAKPAVAAPVTVRTDRGSFTVSPAAIAKSLVLTSDKTGRINPRVDERKLRGALSGQLAKVEVEPKDATYHIISGKPRPIAEVAGEQLDLAALSRDLLAVLPSRDNRQITGALRPAPPEITKAELPGLGIKERVSTFTTHFTGGLSSPRSQNIVTIAKKVDGTLVKPGETFSLNGHTGERGYAQGYRDAPVILDGKLVPGVGGGTSQFTTTLFNAIYYAGLEDVEHKPHSYWFSRYPAVIESTIFYPSLDFKFRNNTEYGVVIDTSYTSSSITVSIWSTRIYEKVTTEYGPRRNITKPKVIYLEPGPSCIETNGIDGFTQDAWRVFRKDGREIRREKFTWRYLAEPRYVCGPEPS